MVEANTISNEELKNAGTIFAAVKAEVHKLIVGQDYLIERLLVALMCDGHVLLEGVPGLAKTRTLTALTTAVDASMSRIQFTPDLLPSDIIGTEVYRPQSGEFAIRKGPVFTNLLLADEINRAPAKVQSALLQAMQERQVTIGDQTFDLPSPFMVLATQNPIEHDGTYPLPEAQLDRFLMKIKVGYPREDEELEILKIADRESHHEVQVDKVLDLQTLGNLRKLAQDLYVDPRVDHYIVAIVQASRNADAFGLKGMVQWGASPRASLALRACARCLTFVRGRSYVTPDEVKELATDVLRHRILTTFEAEARGIDSDEVVRQLVKNVTVP